VNDPGTNEKTPSVGILLGEAAVAQAGKDTVCRAFSKPRELADID
jgi:hypothetical protein